MIDQTTKMEETINQRVAAMTDADMENVLIYDQGKRYPPHLVFICTTSPELVGTAKIAAAI